MLKPTDTAYRPRLVSRIVILFRAPAGSSKNAMRGGPYAQAGSYVRHPVGSRHQPWSQEGGTILVKLRQMSDAAEQEHTVVDAAAWRREHPGEPTRHAYELSPCTSSFQAIEVQVVYLQLRKCWARVCVAAWCRNIWGIGWTCSILPNMQAGHPQDGLWLGMPSRPVSKAGVSGLWGSPAGWTGDKHTGVSGSMHAL